MFNDFVHKNNLYFSDFYDLTNTFQENILRNINNSITQNCREFTKQKYCWNYYHINHLKILHNSRETNINKNNHSYNKLNDSNYSSNKNFEEEVSIVPPIINGYLEIKRNEEYDKEFIFILIARKDNRRTGMRFICRGIDEDGNCANFVETEQIILIYDKYHNCLGNVNYHAISHLQVRGSIPLKWKQPSSYSLVPKVF